MNSSKIKIRKVKYLCWIPSQVMVWSRWWTCLITMVSWQGDHGDDIYISSMMYAHILHRNCISVYHRASYAHLSHILDSCIFNVEDYIYVCNVDCYIFALSICSSYKACTQDRYCRYFIWDVVSSKIVVCRLIKEVKLWMRRLQSLMPSLANTKNR